MRAHNSTDRVTPSHAAWRKSSYSCDSAACVEVALSFETVGVRDSKDVTGPTLSFSADAWRTFIAGVQAGDCDRP